MKGMGYAMEHLPEDAVRSLVNLVGPDAMAPLEEIALAISQNKPIAAPPLLRQWTESGLPDWRFGVLRFQNRSYRRSDALSYDTIDDMMRSGAVRFALAMKQAPIRAVLRNERSWRVECEDERMSKIVRGVMQHVFKRRSRDLLDCLPYGAMFLEKVFDRRSAAEWGIDGVRGNFYGYDDLKPIHPKSIKYIRYKDDGHTFNGFVQQKQIGGELPIDQETALIITYDQMFRNLWGNPATEKMYPFWFWLELCWRAFLRYLQRTGDPVTIVEAPQHGTIIGPDDVEYGTMEYALMMAGYIMNSNAAAMPSDVDMDTKQPLWNVRFLQDQARGDQFIKAIERLSTGLTRSVVVGDMVGQQTSDSGGGYNQSQQHWEVTQLHNEEIVIDLLSQMDRYVVAQIVGYNGSARTPPATLETETLDPRQRERLFELFKIIGNQQDSQAFRTVNWRRVMDENEIPALTQEEIDEEFERELARATKKQEESMKTAQKYQPQGQQGQRQPGGNRPTPQPPGRQRIQQSREFQEYLITQGGYVPVLVTTEQALDMLDRTVRDRPTVFDMGAQLEEDGEGGDEEVEHILREVMSEVGTEGLSAEEIDQLRDYILGLLGLRRIEAEVEQDLVVIDLGIGDFLRRAVHKVRSVIDRVVKRVTGKDLADWKGTRAASPGRGKYVPTAGAVITKDGVVWREEDHPRDESGKFAKKGSAPVKPKDKPRETEGAPPAQTEPERQTIQPEDLETGRGMGSRSGKAHRVPWERVSEEKIDEALSNVTFGDSVPEENRRKYAAMVAAAFENEYLASGTSMDKVHLGILTGEIDMGGVREFGGVYWPDRDEVHVKLAGAIVNGKPDWISDEAVYNILVHELHHSIGGKKGWEKGRGAKADFGTEEATTELLTMIETGYVGRSSYRNETNALIYTMRRAYGDDREKISSEIRNLHSSGNTQKSIIQLLEQAYPNLTRPQLREIRQEVGSPGDFRAALYSEEGLVLPYYMALRFSLQNEYGDDWQSAYDEWYNGSSLKLTPLGYLGDRKYGTDFEWFFTEEQR